MGFGSRILAYQDDILRDLAKLVAIPSICGPAEQGMPFGQAPAEALQCILKIAQDMGFATKNVGNYAGHAEYGSGKEAADVLTHVDVVPAGEGWRNDPFTMVRRGNLIYGRGVADDKGAAVVALYCLKALKDAGVTGCRRLRVVFGSGEEIASDDLEQYYKSESLPVMGFTPDAEYGICNREKGILRVDFTAGQNDSTVVKEFSAGTVVNAVPSKAEARLFCTAEQAAALANAANSAQGDFTVVKTEDGAAVVSLGRASHAMQPQEGFNAATYLLALLGRVFSEQELGALLAFANRAIKTELDGALLGVKQEDAVSGPLTLNLGIVRVTGDTARFAIDIRYPVTADGGAIAATLKAAAENAGLSAAVAGHSEPLYLPADSPFIRLLQDAYHAVTGESAQLYATGGGTYARSLHSRGVAFGPFFPGEPDQCLHNIGEHIDWDRFLLHAQVCLEAMYRMLTEEGIG